jgi:hypothetical protein
MLRMISTVIISHHEVQQDVGDVYRREYNVEDGVGARGGAGGGATGGERGRQRRLVQAAWASASLGSATLDAAARRPAPGARDGARSAVLEAAPGSQMRARVTQGDREPGPRKHSSGCRPLYVLLRRLCRRTRAPSPTSCACALRMPVVFPELHPSRRCTAAACVTH